MRKVFTTVLLTCAAGTATACSCAPIPEVAEGLERSELVVDGTVLGVEDRYVGWRKIKAWFQWRFGPPFPSPVDDGFAVRLKAHQVWKGEVVPEVTLYTSRDSAACGFPFRPGDRYVVYANLLQTGQYEASLCSRTRPRGDDEVALLDVLSRSRKF